MQRRTPSLRAGDRPTRGTGTHPGRDQDDHPTETFGQVPDEADDRGDAYPEDRDQPTQVIDAVRDDADPEPNRPSGADELFGGGPAASEDDRATSVIPRVPADEPRTDRFAAYQEPGPADPPAEGPGGRVAPAAAAAAGGPSVPDAASDTGGDTAPDAATASDGLDPADGDGTDRKSDRAARKAAKAEQKAAAQSAKVERKVAKAEEKSDRKAAARAAKADRRTGPVEETEASTVDSAAPALDASTPADRPATDSATSSGADPDIPAAGADANRTPVANARRPAPVLLVVLLLVVAVAGGGAAWLFREQAGQAAKRQPTSNVAMLDKAATAEAVAQVSAAVEAIYSYDAASLDASESKALALVSRAYADEFKRNFAAVRALSPQQRASLTSKVVAAGVVSLTERRATMLVMVDQQGRRRDSPEPLKAAVRLSVTAQRVDGQWKVSDVNQK